MYGIAAAPSGYATCMQNMHMTCHAACVLCTKCQPNAEAAARLAPGRAGAFRREAALQGTHHQSTQKVHHKMHGSTATSCFLEIFQRASKCTQPSHMASTRHDNTLRRVHGPNTKLTRDIHTSCITGCKGQLLASVSKKVLHASSTHVVLEGGS
jgi:hypothetical protein